MLRRFPFTLLMVRSHRGRAYRPSASKSIRAARRRDWPWSTMPTGQVVWAGELTHRGHQVREGLEKRRVCRRSRRQRHTRYRPEALSSTVGDRKDAFPPCLESRLANVLTWV